MLEIVKSFKKLNTTKMATQNYELKRGVLLQAFGDASKTCTNDTITDELAEWYLKHYPEKAVLFARMPVQQPTPPPEIKIMPPAKSTTKPEITIISPKIAQDDAAEKKLLIKKALELGFESKLENPIEKFSNDELKIIIPNLEKAKAAESIKTESDKIQPESKKKSGGKANSKK